MISRWSSPIPEMMGLPGFRVRRPPERRIFHGQLVQPLVHFLLVGFRLGLDGHGDHRFGELDGFEKDGRILGAQGVAGRGPLETHGRHDISGPGGLDLFPFVGVHFHKPSDPLALALVGVVDRIPGAQAPGIEPQKGQLPHIGIGHDLERQGGKRRSVQGRSLFLGGPFGVDARHRRLVHGRREKIHHGVQELLHPLVLEGGSQEDRNDLGLPPSLSG